MDKNTIVFVVMQGEVTAVLNTSHFVVSREDSFIVPPLSAYNIVDMKAREAELFLADATEVQNGSVEVENRSSEMDKTDLSIFAMICGLEHQPVCRDGK